jgi:hypothetical protein
MLGNAEVKKEFGKIKMKRMRIKKKQCRIPTFFSQSKILNPRFLSPQYRLPLLVEVVLVVAVLNLTTPLYSSGLK